MKRQFALPAGSTLPLLLFPLLLLAAWLVFAPALSGPFLFDDLAHLPKLRGGGDGIVNREDLLRLAFPAHGGSGRTVAYLSLLIDDNHWPSEPRAFKRTNLLLHLLNGVLVFALVRAFAQAAGRGRPSPPDPDWVALAAAALWLLNPMQLSPTMIVIQRMTLLGASFSLLALLAYFRGRQVALRSPRAALFWLVPAFGACLLLGIFSKEIALATVVYVAVVELTLMRGPVVVPRPRWWRWWASTFLVLPILLFLLYVWATWGVYAEAYLTRPFDLSERLLSETRVVFAYLRLVLLPSLSHYGPFQDDFTVSRGLLDPPTTLLSLAAVLGLVTLSLVKLRRWPLFALAVLWFFGGHLLEGTLLPLELYFEHRNYLPMLGPQFALAYWLLSQSARHRPVLRFGLAGFLALEATIAFASAKVWGDPQAMALHWAEERPTSPRAQAVALGYWARHGSPERLLRQLDIATRGDPRNATYPLLRFVLERCSDPSLPSLGASPEGLERAIPGARFEYGSLEVLHWLNGRPIDSCRIGRDEIERIYALYLANPQFRVRPEVLHRLYSQLSSLRQQLGDIEGALTALDDAYAAMPSFGTALMQAFLLLSAGLPDEAERYVDIAAETPPRNAFDVLEKDRQIASCRQLLAETRERKPSGP